MPSILQSRPVAESYSIDRSIEEAVLEKVCREQQEAGINRVIDKTIHDPYSRMVVKLHALDGWRPEDIAKCAGVPKANITQVIRRQERVMDAIRDIVLTPAMG